MVSLSERITTQSGEAVQLDQSKSTNQTILSDKTLIEELQRKVDQLNNENSNLLMQITELIMKNYDLAQSLQMKIVPPCPVMESTTTVTTYRECTIQNQQAPKQNQQNPPVKIKSGKANQEKNQQHQQTQKQSNASKTKTETKQANNVNGNQEQQQQKRSTKQQQQLSKLE